MKNKRSSNSDIEENQVNEMARIRLFKAQFNAAQKAKAENPYSTATLMTLFAINQNRNADPFELPFENMPNQSESEHPVIALLEQPLYAPVYFCFMNLRNDCQLSSQATHQLLNDIERLLLSTDRQVSRTELTNVGHFWRGYLQQRFSAKDQDMPAEQLQQLLSTIEKFIDTTKKPNQP